MKEGVNRLRISKRSTKCYQRQMTCCRRSDSHKSYIAVEDVFISSGKAEWRTYSAQWPHCLDPLSIDWNFTHIVWDFTSHFITDFQIFKNFPVYNNM